ncbi:hypothetical protein ACFLXY_08625 [Chloroflexota bacterium]
MKKAQVVKFWNAVYESTSVKEAIASLENKKGYPKPRTLYRYYQAYREFQKGVKPEDLVIKIGFCLKTLQQLNSWWVKEFSLKTIIENNIPVETEKVAEPSNESSNEKECQCSPDNITLEQLKKKGVPKKKTASILKEWREYHLKGNHNICLIFSKLFEDIKKGFPFDKAEAILKTEISGRLFESEMIINRAELARIYQPWESLENYNAMVAEIESRRKADPNYYPRIDHLNAVQQLYREFHREITDKVSSSIPADKLSIEDDPLFNCLLEHDEEIDWEWGQLYHKRWELEGYKSDIKKAANIERQIKEILKRIQRRIDLITSNREFRDQSCSKCPRLSI